jgi:hypothetical protein
MGVYLHSLIRLHGVVLNLLSKKKDKANPVTGREGP